MRSPGDGDRTNPDKGGQFFSITIGNSVEGEKYGVKRNGSLETLSHLSGKDNKKFMLYRYGRSLSILSNINNNIKGCLGLRGACSESQFLFLYMGNSFII